VKLLPQAQAITDSPDIIVNAIVDVYTKVCQHRRGEDSPKAIA
jgi:hypothetical protein